jgi:hypothetical protein
MLALKALQPSTSRGMPGQIGNGMFLAFDFIVFLISRASYTCMLIQF